LAAPVGAEVAHVPSDCPAILVQAPAQQSASAVQASPLCAQKDDAWQVPPTHSPEQHCALSLHWFPSVAHVVLRVAQVPLLAHF
jgi:hypothetical protein